MGLLLHYFIQYAHVQPNGICLLNRRTYNVIVNRVSGDAVSLPVLYTDYLTKEHHISLTKQEGVPVVFKQVF